MIEKGAVPDRIGEAVTIVAGWPRVWSRLIAEHVAGSDGRCTACSGGNRGAPRWPCGPAALALRARRLHAESRHRPSARQPGPGTM